MFAVLFAAVGRRAACEFLFPNLHLFEAAFVALTPKLPNQKEFYRFSSSRQQSNIQLQRVFLSLREKVYYQSEFAKINLIYVLQYWRF